MKCPSCAYDNTENALCCNLCQFIFPKEKPAPAACPPMAGEPVALKTPEELNGLFLLALKKGTEGQFPVAERLMARLYSELEHDFCGDIVEALGGAWLKTSAAAAEDKQKALILLKATVEGLKRGDLAQAWGTGRPLMALAKDPTAEAAKFALALLGLKGAQTPQGPAASPAAPPSGSANTPRY